MTIGEYKVGTEFNPGKNPVVDGLKQAAAGLINMIVLIPMPEKVTAEQGAEIARLKALAMTRIEEGAMWAVKAATKQAPKEDSGLVKPDGQKLN